VHEEGGRVSESNKIEARHKPEKCPVCGGSPVARIIWGYPNFSPQLEDDLKKGKYTLGGCEVSGDDPVWECSQCHQQIYRQR